MNERLRIWWYEIQDRLWFIPAAMTVGAAVLALALVRLDQALWSDGSLGRGVPFLFDGGAEGARGVLNAIASSVMTVTATIFSITIVALQLASNQFSPRLLRTFTGDRRVQFVLGVFIATFTYSLLVLRSIRVEAEDAPQFVPYIATTIAIGLALGTVGVLIYFIHYISQSMQVAVIVDRTVNAEQAAIDALYPTDDDPDPDEPVAWARPTEPPAIVTSGNHSGYIQTIHRQQLRSCAEEAQLAIEVIQPIGEFVLPGSPVARVWPAESCTDDAISTIRGAFVLGVERTLHADVSLGIRQVTDVALKALSPGINDPSTAIICIDRLCQMLAVIANRRPPSRIFRAGDQGAVIFPAPPTFESFVDMTMTQIRHFGANDPVVASHLVSALGELAEVVPVYDRPVLASQALLVVEQAKIDIAMPADQRRVEEAAAWARHHDESSH